MYSFFRRACERVLRIPHDPLPPTANEASVRIFHAAPAYYKYRLVLWGIGMAFVVCFGGIFLGGLNLAVIYGKDVPGIVRALVFAGSSILVFIFVVYALFSLAVVRLDYEKRWYVVTDRSLRVREGVMKVREMTVTFANIQNVSVMQGPIQRALGIADLQVETAGGGVAHANQKQLGLNLHVAWFRGIDNAKEVQVLIQDRLRMLKDAGLGDHDDHHGQSLQIHGGAAMAVLEALRAVLGEAASLRLAAAEAQPK